MHNMHTKTVYTEYLKAQRKRPNLKAQLHPTSLNISTGIASFGLGRHRLLRFFNAKGLRHLPAWEPERACCQLQTEADLYRRSCERQLKASEEASAGKLPANFPGKLLLQLSWLS